MSAYAGRALELSREDQRQMAGDPEQMSEIRRRLAAMDTNPAPVMTAEQLDEEFPA